VKRIEGHARTIRQLLSGAKYSIDYYQREYKWQTKQVVELLADLSGKFLEDFQTSHERDAVNSYGHYFLGSIIISEKKDQKYIIDGQQRLTTLTLLLIYIYSRHPSDEDKAVLQGMIFSRVHGRDSFNIDIEERRRCMEALFRGQTLDAADGPESVRNIVHRYREIEQHFPDDITPEALPYFADWLIENVHLVEITAYSDEDAYTIFETMNDRGLSLTPAEMLKGYFLANITSESDRLDANRVWKERIAELSELGKDEDADAIKAWLRSQHAKTIREQKKGALPGDFDRLGTEFHRWVREHAREIGLDRNSDFFGFITRDFRFYTKQYLRVRRASQQLTADMESIFYNAQHEFTLQYPLPLSPLDPEDDERTVLKKLRLVSTFLDILIARRLWNFRLIAYSTMQYAMFVVMREIRSRNPSELAAILRGKLDADQETFSSNERLRMHQQDRYPIHQILARITDHIERSSGLASRYLEYVSEGSNRYEVEHILADHPERHSNGFAHASDFAEYRNRIGGLLLLPKSFNASYGDLPYDKKLDHYDSQNLLGRSLHARCYDHNPGFVSYVSRSRLLFHAHPQFLKEDLDARQELYRHLADEVWNPARIDKEVSQ
jgi:hypothetical protein